MHSHQVLTRCLYSKYYYHPYYRRGNQTQSGKFPAQSLTVAKEGEMGFTPSPVPSILAVVPIAQTQSLSATHSFTPSIFVCQHLICFLPLFLEEFQEALCNHKPQASHHAKREEIRDKARGTDQSGAERLHTPTSQAPGAAAPKAK